MSEIPASACIKTPCIVKLASGLESFLVKLVCFKMYYLISNFIASLIDHFVYIYIYVPIPIYQFILGVPKR